MASILRLGSRQIFKKLLSHEKCGMLALVRPVQLKSERPTPPTTLNHDAFNMQMGRPMSPHLSIYAPELTSFTSLLHRASGIALAGYTILFSFATLVLPKSIPHYIDVLAEAHVGTPIIFIAKFILAVPLCYHLFNGLRHLSWDLALGLQLKEIYLTGYLMFTVTLLTTLAVSAM